LWLNLAAMGSQGKDQKDWIKDRDEIAARLTSEQLAQAQERARAWVAAHPDQPTNSDVPKSIDMQSSGKAFLQVCSAADHVPPGWQTPGWQNPLSKSETAAVAQCVGYVEGVLGALQDPINFYCSSQGSPPRMLQILQTVLNYIRNNPDTAYLPPTPLVVTALRQAFPCDKK